VTDFFTAHAANSTTIEFDENYRLMKIFIIARLLVRQIIIILPDLSAFQQKKTFAYITGSCFAKKISRNKLRFNISSNFYAHHGHAQFSIIITAKKISVLQIFRLDIFHAFFKRNYFRKVSL
jgi:hypothetical protein